MPHKPPPAAAPTAAQIAKAIEAAIVLIDRQPRQVPVDANARYHLETARRIYARPGPK